MSGHNVCCLAVLVLVVTAIATAQTATIGTIACDAEGRVHLLNRGSGADGRPLVHQVWGDSGWSEPVAVSQGRMPMSADLAISTDGVIHGVWSDITGPDAADIFYATYADGRWSEPKNVSEAPGFDWQPKVAVVEPATVIVVWQKVDGRTSGDGFRTSGFGAGLQARVCVGGQWGETQTLTDAGEGPPSVAVKPDGEVHVFCAAPSDSLDHGLHEIVWQTDKWGEITVAEGLSGIDAASQLSVAYDATGSAHMLLKTAPGRRGPGGTFYTKQSEGRWGPMTPMGQAMGPAGFCVSAAPDGTVHMVWAAAVNFRNATCYSQYKDGAWTQASPVTYETALNYRLSVDTGGQVHVLLDAMPNSKHIYGDPENGWEMDVPG